MAIKTAIKQQELDAKNDFFGKSSDAKCSAIRHQKGFGKRSLRRHNEKYRLL